MAIREIKTIESEVCIPLWRYNELLKKEFVFDILKAEAEDNEYTLDHEKRLFGIKVKEGDE